MTDKKIRNMAEFAELSGISRPTISKYFNDPASVRKSIRTKIEKALAKNDYRPNLFAVNLNKRKPKIIGVIVPDTGDMFYSELVRHIEYRCSQSGYFVLVLNSRGDARLEARSIDTLLSLKIAGAIIAPLGLHSDEGLMDSLRSHIPIVFLDSRLNERSPFVGTDNYHSIGLMTEYLCRTGSAPTYFQMPDVNNNARERRLAYIATMERLGLQPQIVGVEHGNDWRFEEMAYITAQRILAGSGFPTTTLLCANDRVAVGAMAAITQNGIRIGRDADCGMRIAGHDDQPNSRYCCPPLTTVAQNFSRLGTMGVELLLAQIEAENPLPGGGAEQIKLEGTLMLRTSA